MNAHADEEELVLPRESSERMIARHAEEWKELRKRLDRMRSSIPKKDRAGRARAAEEAAESERNLAARHTSERAELGIVTEELDEDLKNLNVSSHDSAPSKDSDMHKIGGVRESKAARRRRKKADQEAESRRRIEDEKANMGRSPKFVEIEAIDAQLKPRGLRIHQIVADGHCLYSAVAHQMTINKFKSHVPASVEGLRGATADFLMAHRNEYMPFIETVEGSEERFRQYCERVRKEAVWGGQVEVKAMAELLGTKIEVYAAGMPVVQMGTNDEGGTVLRVSFHRQYFGLGEHYNSVVSQA